MKDKKYFKIISNVIVILSLLFVINYLIDNNLITTVRIGNYFLLSISIVLLLLGYIVDFIVLRSFLNYSEVKISMNNSIILEGKYSLAKYIPGKVSAIIAKAAYLAEKTKTRKLKSLEVISVYQIMFMVSSVLISVIILYYFLLSLSENIILVFGLIIILTVLLSLHYTQNKIRLLIRKLFKIEISGIYSKKNIIYTIIGTGFCWFSWVIGFMLFAKSIGTDISLNAAFLFPLASLAGVIAIFSPGGLGVREGVISAGLVFFGYGEVDAISLSVYSRLWFLIGELIVFIIAVILSKYDK